LIAGSLVVSLALITTAFVISGESTEVSAQNAQELLRAYAVKDTDADGLPDWQEQLYATDPENPNSVDASMTDSEAVAAGLVKPRFESEEVSEPVNIDDVPGVRAGPQTTTDRFARLFFEQYLTMRGSEPPTPETLLLFVENAVEELGETNQIPRAYSSADVRNGGSGDAALRTYSIGADGAFARTTGGANKDAMYYFGKVVYKEDTAALKPLAALGKAYAQAGETLIRVPAPKEVEAVHLRLANSLSLLGVIINDLTQVNEDPLRAFLVLSQYEDAAEELAESLLAYDRIYDAAGVVVTPEEPGYLFYYIINRVGDAALRLQYSTP